MTVPLAESPIPALESIEAYAKARGYTLIRMADVDAPVVAALSKVWDHIRAEDPRVPGVTFSLQPGRSSGCSSVEWDAPVVVMNLMPTGDKLSGAEILDYLLHLAAHGAVGPTASSEGRWHSEGYRNAAEGLGLAVERGPAGTGWSRTSLARGTRTRYQSEISGINRAMAQWEPAIVRKHSRSPVSIRCSCSPPRVLQARPSVAAQGQIRCEICRAPFLPAR
jgi:hypothetical protein